MQGIASVVLAAVLATAPAWELVATLGRVKTVYVEPARIKDKQVLRDAVKAILEKEKKDAPVEIDFFDDKLMTPRTLPFPAGTRPHQKAKFNFNPANGMKKFVWVEPMDPNHPEGRPKYIEDDLKLD
jgi:hypothetical protein